MDRLISEQAVLEAFREYQGSISDFYKAVKAITSAEPKIVPIAEIKFNDDMLHEIVEEAVKNIEIEPKWIPVSERLPEKNVWVLVTVVQGSGWYVEIMRIDKYKGMFTDNIDYYDSIIAWMPLPKPYREDGEEE